ncbi:hypothetical protein G6F31_016079 [Rhizopus arrhizus]|nr:hypothetical protein G6F31_016079 [Rhizopus arrhizus]
MSYTQIARHCGITAKTVEKHIARALQGLRQDYRHTEDASLFERASAWVARLEAPDCTPAERETFEDWLAENPAHVKAWVQAENLFQQGQGLAADPWLRTAAARAARPPRRRWLPAFAAAAGICLAIGMGWMRAVDGNPTPQRYANDSHETQQLTLADGSVATLDAGTTLHALAGRAVEQGAAAARRQQHHPRYRHDLPG